MNCVGDRHTGLLGGATGFLPTSLGSVVGAQHHRDGGSSGFLTAQGLRHDLGILVGTLSR